jgi:hypothetical protein
MTSRGVYPVPWFRRHRSLAIRKIPEFPRRNAKTRWGEPAGHFASSHLAVAVLVEAVSWTRNLAKIGSCFDSNATQPKGSFSVSVGALKGATFERF